MSFLTDTLDRLLGSRRATIDDVTAAPAPLQPIDLTDDAVVAEALDVAVRVGEVLLASGTGAIDTAEQVRFVAATYGLARCDVDVTYNSIVLSAYRGPTMPPASTMRVVQYRSMDFTRLAAVDRLTRRIRRDAISPSQAHEELLELTTAPHPYNRWVATVAWSGMAAAIAVLLGGEAVVALMAFASTFIIDRVNRILNTAGLPFFFQHLVGGIIATAPAITLYGLRNVIGYEVSPGLIIAAGVTVLLSGLSLVGSVQDAITGAPITASARFFELLMMTGGIIAGVATTLRIAGVFGAELPLITYDPLPDLTELPTKVVAGAGAAMFYALACYAERRALTVAALGGAAGSLGYQLALGLGLGPIISSAVAATVIGFAGGLMARRALTPPLVVAVAGITPLLPGLALYRGLYAMLRNEIATGLTALFAAFGIGCALAAGVTLGEWLARSTRHPRSLLGASGLRRPQMRRIGPWQRDDESTSSTATTGPIPIVTGPLPAVTGPLPTGSISTGPISTTGPIPLTGPIATGASTGERKTRATLRLRRKQRDPRRI
ncbi:threonine/serine exporter family protein [Rhodococcus chondri]|uniref:Threonine/serine exporter family protein n=1 Tax=Rhodococcus chondri TaxID=3065941 RepID=A0ABU7JRN4_9NOCA|nr:threonine/serine exporter family protein [Rhodococcus sp. CC-R104]MEE2032691.1 threonine/serine exporter family protein [Rhodococcus sp. CC-R104]